MRGRFFTPRLRVTSYEELNALLLDKAIAYARAHRHPAFRDQTIWEAFEVERPSLVPYAGPFDGFHGVTASVSKTCLVRFESRVFGCDQTLLWPTALSAGAGAQALCLAQWRPFKELDRQRALGSRL